MIEGLEYASSSMEEEIEGVLGEIGVPAQVRRPAARRISQRAVKPFVRQAHNAGQNRGKNSVMTAAAFRTDITSKGFFEMKKNELPPEIVKGLANRALQVVDANIYGIKAIEGKSVIDLLTSSDDKATGRSNLNGAKLDLNEHFLVTAVCLDFGTFPDGGAATDSDFVDDLPAKIKNGEFELKVGAESLLPENISCEIFNNESTDGGKRHIFKLDHPKWIKPQMEIKPRLTMTKAGAALEAVKFTLVGCKVHKK
ncbi:hypothetical protein [Marinilabilia salmonicolor]|uniref:hypothetical protein n=2 Tax=Marinilabilia salmonicolor TaxID=989 RepID=UPI00029ABFD0|nr:hypothetical protein [Marinilabilia salmonicolor]